MKSCGRDLEEGVEHEAEAALAEARAADVALDLRLVGAEVGKRKEETAEDAAPDCVADFEVGVVVDGLEFAEGARR